MTISIFDLFSIGIGPSSSHTVGPMRAAYRFVEIVLEKNLLAKTFRLKTELFGSLALTGKGHATDTAILLGLFGEVPEKVDPEIIPSIIDNIQKTKTLHLLKKWPITFNEKKDLLFLKSKRLPYHSNAMRFTIYDENKEELFSQIYYSIGGGFIQEHEEAFNPLKSVPLKKIPYPFETCNELLALCDKHHLTIAGLMMENEKAFRKETDIVAGLYAIWKVMQQCVEKACHKEGFLPGGLRVERRAPKLYKHLLQKTDQNDPSIVMDWASLYALAVNEENAAGGQVVTAPTNGAAGVLPAVMHYYQQFTRQPKEDWVIEFLLTAAAIGILYKKGASISAAEMGCQGEIGVACSMAAGALAALLGGSNKHVEIAAEIGMEHNLGLTCDPINGLVQIPCIERNTMGTIKAINAARLALIREGDTHRVSLDQVIKTMFETGLDMSHKYKETSQGGLAMNVTAC